MYGPLVNINTEEQRTCKNRQLKMLYQSPSILGDITKRRLIWTGQAWGKEGSLLKTILENAPQRKRPLRHSILRQEYRVKEDMEKIKL